MSSCYTLSLHSMCPAPMLPSVRNCYILSMSNPRTDVDALAKLCRRTHIQYNQGFRKCTKPDWVVHSGFDIIHAYRHLFRMIEDDGPILVMEDDAQFMPAAKVSDFSEVDNHVQSHEFDLYTLGSMGCMQILDSLNRKFLGSVNFAQAIIWSKAARNLFLRSEPCKCGHIDAGFLSSRMSVHTYYKPLVVQTFPATENQSNWCFICTPKDNAFDAIVWSRIVPLLVRLTRLDTCTGFWDIAYKMQTVEYLMMFFVVIWCTALSGKF